MDREPGDTPDTNSEESMDELLDNLDKAKKLDETATERRRRKTGSGLQNVIRRRTDAAVLASNHEARLEEIVENDAVTHRSGKKWKSAKVGVEAHGRLPLYYRQDGAVTHKGYISRIELDPDGDAAEEFLQHITDADTYSDYNDRLDTTTFVVTDGEALDDPFPQSELRKLADSEPIDEDYSYQPAYVVQRPGDFPDFG